MTHFSIAQAAAWVAVAGGAWAIVRAGAAKGVLKVRSPVRCAACGRRRTWGRCPCTQA
jgi:hypothetical protein